MAAMKQYRTYEVVITYYRRLSCQSNWTTRGARKVLGALRPCRRCRPYSHCCRAEKRKRTWLVVAAQNTNGGSGPPELGNIEPPIVVPRAA